MSTFRGVPTSPPSIFRIPTADADADVDAQMQMQLPLPPRSRGRSGMTFEALDLDLSLPGAARRAATWEAAGRPEPLRPEPLRPRVSAWGELRPRVPASWGSTPSGVRVDVDRLGVFYDDLISPATPRAVATSPSERLLERCDAGLSDRDLEVLIDFFRLPAPYPDEPAAVVRHVWSHNACAPDFLASVMLQLLDLAAAAGPGASARDVLLRVPLDLGLVRRQLEVHNSCSEITPRLFLGGFTVARDAALLRARGITHIVNCASPWCDTQHEDIAILNLKLNDLPGADLTPYFKAAIQFLEKALRDPNAKVLVHCYAGISRSATLLAAYLAWAHEWSGADALDFVREKRSVVQPNEDFLRQLEVFDPRSIRFD